MISIVYSSMNYGGIGTVIGHELTHSLDKDSIKLDENIISLEWLDKESMQKIIERRQCFMEQYDNFGFKDYNVSLL